MISFLFRNLIIIISGTDVIIEIKIGITKKMFIPFCPAIDIIIEIKNIQTLISTKTEIKVSNLFDHIRYFFKLMLDTNNNIPIIINEAYKIFK